MRTLRDMPDVTRRFARLLQHIDSTRPRHPKTWDGWSIAPISGGANNLLYRATGENGDYAVKFTIRDGRDRAGREYGALCALQQAGLHIAPEPVLLERDGYGQPVVVQSWLHGEALTGPPQGDAEWTAFLDHYAALHSVTSEQVSLKLAAGYLNVSSGDVGKALVCDHAAMLPPDARPKSLQDLLAWFERWSPPVWPAPAQTLVRVDGNWRNFLRCGDGLASVDWEYSGWGDPAFEFAELALHPAYEGVPGARWDQLAADFAHRRNDPTAVLRIQTYTTIMLVWWLVRWARYLYEVPRGLDSRLVSRPEGWLANVERQYNRYLAMVQARSDALAR